MVKRSEWTDTSGSPEHIARERIAEVRASGAGSLFLSDLGLSALPAEVGELTHLRVLQLGRNQLVSLPPGVAQLEKLTHLDLQGNRLTSVPGWIGRLGNLIKLDLRGNRLTALPPTIGALKKLMALLLEGNQLTSLPPEISGLAQLVTLDLTGNCLTVLPPEIGGLYGIERLYLDSNSLVALCKEIRNLRHLEHLYLHENFGLGLAPEVLGPPWHDVHQGAAAARACDILDYYFRIRTEVRRKLNEAKVLVVGPEAVGKTSLVKFLVYDKACNPHEGKTPGVNIRERINIENWPLATPSGVAAGDEPLRLNVWDFGGQEILYGTHQFFLTKRSLYLLVLEARRENDESIHYWLKTIRNRGGDAPIVVVINKDEPPHALRLDEPRLQKEYPNIQAFVRTSCLERGRDSIRRLRDIIARIVGDGLPHVRDELPERDLAVKAELARRARVESVLDLAAYRALCVQNEIHAPRDQDLLLKLLNDLGTVIAHSEEDATEAMHNVTLLDPNWITSAVYRLFTHADVRDANGELAYDDIGRLLDGDAAYPPHRWRFIIDMMECFGLCYEVPHTQHKRFLVPEQLPSQEPDISFAEDAALRFRYEYELLPSGLLPRFIVQGHENLTEKPTVWRNGAVLQADGCKVLVRADRKRDRIEVYVDGPAQRRRAALAVIRHHLDVVHRLNPQSVPREKIPLPDDPGLEADYRTLLAMEEAGKDDYWPDGATREYSVATLLNGVSTAEQRQQERAARSGQGRDKPGNRVTLPRELAGRSTAWTWLADLVGPLMTATAVAALALLLRWRPTAWYTLLFGVFMATFAVVYVIRVRARHFSRWLACGFFGLAGVSGAGPTLVVQFRLENVLRADYVMDRAYWVALGFGVLSFLCACVEAYRERRMDVAG